MTEKKSEKELKIKKLREDFKKGKLTSEKACIVMACEPTVKYFLDNIINNLPDYINIEKTKQMIKIIEKEMFKRNVYKKRAVVISTAIFLVNHITKIEAGSLGGCREAAIRTLIKKLKFRFRLKIKKEPSIFDSYLY